MRNFRLLIIALATICVLALGAFALVHRSPQDPGDDVIIIKGGSLSIECPKNQGAACLGVGAPDTTTGKYKYTHKNGNSHIMQIVVKDDTGYPVFTRSFTSGHQPKIEVIYK